MKKSRSRSLLLAAGLVFAVVFGASAILRSLAAPPGQPGNRFPDLAALEIEGKIPDLKGKVVLIDLWASWCGPCKQAFPAMQAIHESFKARPFTVVAVSLDEKKSDMDEFLAKAKPVFPTLRDAKGKLAEALGVESIPTSILVGTDGKILARHEGFDGETTRKELTAEIEKALAPPAK